MRTAAALALVALTACGERRIQAPGQLSLEWTSSDSAIGSARWSGEVEAGWCEAEHRLTLFAARGDTGAALLVHLPALEPASDIPLVATTATDSASTTDSSRADTSRADSGSTASVIARAVSVPARRATIAVRWSDDRAVMAMKSGSGSLSLTRTMPTLAGRFDGTLAPPDSESDAPVLRGRLADVRVATGDAGCALAGVGQAPDTGVP